MPKENMSASNMAATLGIDSLSMSIRPSSYPTITEPIKAAMEKHPIEKYKQYRMKNF